MQVKYLYTCTLDVCLIITNSIRPWYYLYFIITNSIRPLYYLYFFITNSIRPLYYLYFFITNSIRPLYYLYFIITNSIRPLYYLYFIITNSIRPLYYLYFFITNSIRPLYYLYFTYKMKNVSIIWPIHHFLFQQFIYSPSTSKYFLHLVLMIGILLSKTYEISLKYRSRQGWYISNETLCGTNKQYVIHLSSQSRCGWWSKIFTLYFIKDNEEGKNDGKILSITLPNLIPL